MAGEREQLLERARLIQQAKQIQQQKMQQQAPPPEEPGAMDTALEYGGKALDVGLRTLDLPGGLVRTGWKGLQNIPRAAAKGLEELGIESDLAKKPHLVTTEDFKKALQGRAPTMSEFMEREGADPGLATSAVGMGMDIALDPLTYMSFGTSALKKGAEKTGRAVYKSGLKAVDAEAIKYGKEPVSDLLIKEGVTGSYQQIQKRMDELAQGYLAQRDEILARATRAGGEVDMGEAMAPLLNKISEIEKSGDPNLMALAQMMKDDAAEYLAKGAKEPEQILRELPVGGKYTPERTDLALVRGEGGKIVYKKTDPQFSMVEKLPTAADYKPPYRQVKTPAGKLPLGAQEPVSTDIATKFREWKKMQEIPEAILPGQAPLNVDEMVKMGQIVPEGTKYIPGSTTEMIQSANPRMYGDYVPPTYSPQKAATVLDEGVMVPVSPGSSLMQVAERVPGPTPKQVSGWKSSTYGKVGNPAWEAVKHAPAAKELQKTKAYGLKKATETSVEKALGNLSKEELIELNRKLGQILTTDEKAAKEAMKEINKNYFTSVDAPIAVANWKAAIAKKLADIAKTTSARTKTGKALMDRSKESMLLERNLLTTPWLQINRSRED